VITNIPRSFGVTIVVLLLISGAIFIYGQAPSAGKTTQAPRPEQVILISVDGMPPDYYNAPEKLGLRAPTLSMMKQSGAHAEGMEGVYTTVTYPQHTTMVTGLRPAAHGIVQNRIFEAPSDPQTRYWYWYANALKGETLWMAAKKAGLTTAAVSITIGPTFCCFI